MGQSMNKDEEIEILEVDDNKSVTTNDTTTNNNKIDNNEALTSTKVENKIDDLVVSPYSSADNTTKSSNTKYIMTVILFVFLLVIVYFLPNISTFLSGINKKDTANVEKITTGTLKCTLQRSDKTYDYSYLSEFDFENSKILSLNYTLTTTGDETIDREQLEEKYNKCSTLESMVKTLDGVSIKCNLNKGVLTEEQILVYASIDSSKVTSTYSEAGLVYPNFKKGNNIDTIESGMKASGYNCERSK